MIVIHKLKKSFGDKQVLDGVDLEVVDGETHVVLGRSGEGKSVLIKHICGLLLPDTGWVSIDGVRLHTRNRKRNRPILAKVQMLFQGSALFDSMTVAQNVAFHAIEHGTATLADAERVAAEFLEMVNLADAGGLSPAEISGGMKKRAALARALAAHPNIMLYDEPTTGLDPITSAVIDQLIRETQRRVGVTSIVVTHDLRSAKAVGDRFSFLSEGKIIETGSMEQLLNSPHAVIREFMADLKEVNPVSSPR